MHQLGPKSLKEVEYFRRLLIHLCQQNQLKDSTLANKYWIYSPPQDLLKKESIEGQNIQQIQENLIKFYQEFRTEDFFHQEVHADGTANDSKAIDMSAEVKKICVNLEKHPTLIVILSGVFSEFIDSIPFQEVFEKDSHGTLETKWLNIVEKYNLSDFHDYMPHTTLEGDELGVKTVSLEKLMRMQTLLIDNVEVPVVFMETPRFSFESIGDQYIVAAHYLRRLEKFARHWETNLERVILVGYSRGATMALEMAKLIKHKDSQHPFKKSLKGVISLGGVLYGTHLATESMVSLHNKKMQTSDPTNAKTLYYLNELANQLEYVGSEQFEGHELLHKSKIFIKNTFVWLTFFKNIGLQMTFDELIEGQLNFQNIQEKLLELLLKISGLRYLDKSVTNEFLKMLLFNSFHLKAFYKEYDLNIKKFKITVAKILTALDQITIEQRYRWWKKNKIPTKDIFYWAITAITADANTTPMGEHIVNNPWTYIPNHLDDWVMRHCHERLATLSGSTLNDGQVVLPFAMFQNEMNAMLNPYYEKNKIKGPIPLILGVNHWGMAFPIVHPRLDNKRNGFPRKEFLMSMLLYLTKKIKSSERSGSRLAVE